MKFSLFASLAIITIAILTSCDMQKFSAGSYPYAERINIKINKNDVVNRLHEIKNNSNYSFENNYSDGPNSENNNFYNFYFFSKRNNFLLHLNVIEEHENSTTVLLIGIKDFNTSDKWMQFNKDIPKDK